MQPLMYFATGEVTDIMGWGGMGWGGKGSRPLRAGGEREAFNRMACLLITLTGQPKVNAITWKPFNSGANGGCCQITLADLPTGRDETSKKEGEKSRPSNYLYSHTHKQATSQHSVTFWRYQQNPS